MKIRVDDTVMVITGSDKGTTGKVVRVFPKENRVIVEGVARVWKHVRRSQKNPQGGRLNREMPIPASKVMAICPQTGKPTRVGVRYMADGAKERFAKVSGASMGAISPARPAYAKQK